jgi:hypothetical protein
MIPFGSPINTSTQTVFGPGPMTSMPAPSQNSSSSSSSSSPKVSLFQGSPQTATSYTTQANETPRWMQDAIYNQIQLAQNVAATPYQPYQLPTVAELSPLQQRAYQDVVSNQGAWRGASDAAQAGMLGMSTAGTTQRLRADQDAYTVRPGVVEGDLASGRNAFSQAGAQNITGAAQPFLGQAAGVIGQSLGERSMGAASPFLQNAGQSAATQVGQYMSPYQQNVLDTIARQGAKNLTENILPGVSDTFIKAGQFGSSRMGEMGSRAVRDTQRAIIDAQSQAAQQGFGQAMGAAQTDLARQAQLAGTAGNISGSDLTRMLQGGSQLADIGQTAGNLTGQQMGQLTNLGQAQTQAGQAQQQFGLNAAQFAQQAQAGDYQRQMGALNDMSNLARQGQTMAATDVASLEGAGAAQQGQQQRMLNAAAQQYDNARLYPMQQLDWLNTQIRGMAPITPQTQTRATSSTGETYSPSPLSQIAGGLNFYKGMQNI